MTGTAMGTVDYSGYYSRYYSRYYWPKFRYYKSVIKPIHSRYRAQSAPIGAADYSAVNGGFRPAVVAIFGMACGWRGPAGSTAIFGIAALGMAAVVPVATHGAVHCWCLCFYARGGRLERGYLGF